jgi:hypothetical protein
MLELSVMTHDFFWSAADLVRRCVVRKRVIMLHYSYARFQSRYRRDGVYEVQGHYI